MKISSMKTVGSYLLIKIWPFFECSYLIPLSAAWKALQKDVLFYTKTTTFAAAEGKRHLVLSRTPQHYMRVVAFIFPAVAAY